MRQPLVVELGCGSVWGGLYTVCELVRWDSGRYTWSELVLHFCSVKFVSFTIGLQSSLGGGSSFHVSFGRKPSEYMIGNMFPGVALPFGQVKLGIDTSVVNLDQGGISSANSGYTPLGNSTGFSMLHTSGTGGRKCSSN